MAQNGKSDAAKNATTAGDASKPAPTPPERNSVTHHTIALNGQTIHYTATVGTLIVRDGQDEPYGSFFYVAYTQDGMEPKARPVTFLYNGGPGSSSMWLHMGSFGPVRIETDSPQVTSPAPYHLVPNPYSLLDKTDLVFIDAMGTGFSKPVTMGRLKEFLGVDQDVLAFNRFITRYITVNQRWNSPKFLIGESYGATRSAALSYSLEKSGIALNGVVLVSSNLNHNGHAPGLDDEYINGLPSYAATAWYHDKLANKPSDLKFFLEQVRTYARGPYAEALAQGQNLSATEEDQVAQKLSEMTGLRAQYLKESNLRVSASDFRKELMRQNRRTLGRYDARFEGIDMDAVGEVPTYDPSSTGITGAFIAAFYSYLADELKYTTDDIYHVTAHGPDFQWDWKHTPPDGSGGNGRELVPDVALDLGAAMRQNPHLQLFSANGYFDLATPFFQTEYDIAHMELDPTLRKNIRFGYYPSGHMIYLNVEALKQLKGDLAQFYSTAVTQ
uniref:Carboxypeptidase C n=1 Tax=mine drainage metagenome TaxID=410659 RepID=E6PZ50_9ZZZZ